MANADHKNTRSPPTPPDEAEPLVSEELLALADGLAKTLRVMKSAKKESPALMCIWNDDISRIEKAEAVLRAAAAPQAAVPVAWRLRFGTGEASSWVDGQPPRQPADTTMKVELAYATPPSTAVAMPGREAAVADQMIGAIEDRFPNWKSYRDLIDCIDCTLHDLRRASEAPLPAAGVVTRDKLANLRRVYPSHLAREIASEAWSDACEERQAPSYHIAQWIDAALLASSASAGERNEIQSSDGGEERQASNPLSRVTHGPSEAPSPPALDAGTVEACAKVIDEYARESKQKALDYDNPWQRQNELWAIVRASQAMASRIRDLASERGVS